MTVHRLHTPRASRVLQTQLVLPPDTNALGTLFGGRLAQWIDLAAAAGSEDGG